MFLGWKGNLPNAIDGGGADVYKVYFQNILVWEKTTGGGGGGVVVGQSKLFYFGENGYSIAPNGVYLDFIMPTWANKAWISAQDGYGNATGVVIGVTPGVEYILELKYGAVMFYPKDNPGALVQRNGSKWGPIFGIGLDVNALASGTEMNRDDLYWWFANGGAKPIEQGVQVISGRANMYG